MTIRLSVLSILGFISCLLSTTIQEFQVITNSSSAEFGRGYGAVVLVQTKSGTRSQPAGRRRLVQAGLDAERQHTR